MNQDEAAGLGTTRSAFKSAMVTLADYDEDFNEDPEDEPSLNDSGIAEGSTENDESEIFEAVDSSTELAVLRKKIRELEKENEQLTVQLKTSRCSGKFFRLKLVG